MKTVFNGRITWHPLETVLGTWLDSIRKGDVEAVPKDGGKNRLEHQDGFINDPWELVPYSDLILDETINAFNRLVGAVEARMPKASTMDPDDIVRGLVDQSVLQSIKLPQGFAYHFLRRARRPRFQMIAPGLQVSTPSTFSPQPFWPPRVEGQGEGSPVLLFRSKHNYVESSNGAIPSRENAPFSLYKLSIYPAGLHLLSSHSSSSTEDEIRFILPFGIGANGYARKTDGSRFGQNRESKEVEPKDRFADLYRPGYQPFTEMHEQRLVSLLKSWRGMVECGDWEVDENGVAGGMDVWREADTELGWEKYVISLLAC